MCEQGTAKKSVLCDQGTAKNVCLCEQGTANKFVLCEQGTAKNLCLCEQGTAKKSAADLEQLSHAHAIQLSSDTGRELISVQAKCLASQVPKGMLNAAYRTPRSVVYCSYIESV